METVLRELQAWLGSGSINIFGMPFAGKDTLAHNLSALLDAPVISGGDILRAHSDQATIKKLMATGELFPTDYYLNIVLPFISQPKFSGKPLILSSLGRWSGEEPTIIQACEQADHPIKAVLHLSVSKEAVWNRFEASQNLQDRSHRHDDAAHILEIRLQEYEQKTKPVLEFYRQKGLLVEIDGHQKIEDTATAAVRALYDFCR
jgi:adenylate kinase